MQSSTGWPGGTTSPGGGTIIDGSDDSSALLVIAYQHVVESGRWDGRWLSGATRASPHRIQEAQRALVDLQVQFTGPGGQPLQIPAFWFQDFDPATLLPSGHGGWRAR